MTEGVISWLCLFHHGYVCVGCAIPAVRIAAGGRRAPAPGRYATTMASTIPCFRQRVINTCFREAMEGIVGLQLIRSTQIRSRKSRTHTHTQSFDTHTQSVFVNGTQCTVVYILILIHS